MSPPTSPGKGAHRAVNLLRLAVNQPAMPQPPPPHPAPLGTCISVTVAQTITAIWLPEETPPELDYHMIVDVLLRDLAEPPASRSRTKDFRGIVPIVPGIPVDITALVRSSRYYLPGRPPLIYCRIFAAGFLPFADGGTLGFL